MPIVLWMILITVAALLAALANVWAVLAVFVLSAGASVLASRRSAHATATRINAIAVYDYAADGAGQVSDAAGGDEIERLGQRVGAALSRATDESACSARHASTLWAYLNAVDTPIVATDATGAIVMMNDQAHELFDHIHPALFSQHEEDAGAPDLSGSRLKIGDLVGNPDVVTLHGRARRGETCRGRARLAIGSNARYYDVSAAPIRTENTPTGRAGSRSGVVLTLSDVDALAQTLRLRTDFAANASHELRTPIASIKAAIETLRGAAADDPAMHDKLESVIENNATRLEETVDDLLDLSRLEAETGGATAESVDALALCESLSGRFDTVCEHRGLEIEFELDPALRRMVSDHKRLVLILRNLVDNATKFAFENTTVHVRGESLSPALPHDTRWAARFSVTDRGVGIPLAHQARVFERFYQVDESRARIGGRRGSGLGLSIVRHAVRSIGGTIAVESVWQEGTTMTVTIPGCVEAV